MAKSKKQMTKEEQETVSTVKKHVEGLTSEINKRINRAEYVIKDSKQELEKLAKQLKIQDLETLITVYALELVTQSINVNHNIDMEDMALKIIGSAKVNYFEILMKNFKEKSVAEKARKAMSVFFEKKLKKWYVDYSTLEMGDNLSKELLPIVVADGAIKDFIAKNNIKDVQNLFTYILEATIHTLFTKYRQNERNEVDKKMTEISSSLMKKSFAALSKEYPKLVKQIKVLKNNAEKFANDYYNQK